MFAFVKPPHEHGERAANGIRLGCSVEILLLAEKESEPDGPPVHTVIF
jgi:hypothetical protein